MSSLVVTRQTVWAARGERERRNPFDGPLGWWYIQTGMVAMWLLEGMTLWQ
jgi:hypothetical protein